MEAFKIETVILELLADDAGVAVAEQRAVLESAGSVLPIDSLLLAEIVTRLEERVGIRVPEDLPTAKTMNSVRAFSAHLGSIATTVGTR